MSNTSAGGGVRRGRAAATDVRDDATVGEPVDPDHDTTAGVDAGGDDTVDDDTVDDDTVDEGRDFPEDDAEPNNALPSTVDRTDHRFGPQPQSPILPYDRIPNELAESIRGIINRTELRAGTSLPKSIAVTSALLGEGVTTTSQAMATLITQEMNSFTCWVDCSWLSPGQVVDDDRPSLIDILADQSRVHQAFQTTADLPNLLSFSPGPVPDEKRNMIVRSPEFDRLFDILADEFDHIIFDLPPILSNANSLALLRRADASFLVVKHRSTSLAQVGRAIEVMDPTPNLGVLLNQYRSRVPLRLRRLLGE